MQFSTILLTTAAFAVSNAVIITNPGFSGISVGTPFNITWSGAVGAVTLTLKDGPTNGLKTVSVISSGLGTGGSGSFIWTPSTSLATGDYAIQIDDTTGTPNYSEEFSVTGGVASSSSASASSISASSSTASSNTASGSTTASSSITESTTVSTSGSSSSATVTAVTTSRNSTSSVTTTASSSKSSSSSKASTSASGSSVPTTAPSSAAGLASPLAFVFLAFAAFLSLN